MQILTPGGYKDFVAAFLAGTLIVAHSPIAEGSRRYNNIRSVDFVDKVDHVKINGVRLAALQSIWANERLQHVSDVKVGDTIYDARGKPVEVRSVEDGAPGVWWRFVIDGDHSFVCEDICLHNASRFWVGSGSANTWAATSNTNWGATSGGSNNQTVPGVGDLAIFDSNSPAGTGSVISANITVQGLDCTGGTGDFAFTITHNTSVTLTINTGAASSLRFSAGMTYTPASTSSIIAFTHTSGTANITCNGKKLFALTINGAGGTTQPLDALLVNFGSNAIFTLTQGTFNANNFAVTAALFVSSANNTRAITMGSGLWTIGNPTSGTQTIWSIANTGTLTFTKNTANIEVGGTTTSARTFTGGALTYNDLTVDGNSLGGPLLIGGANTFAHLAVSAPNTIQLPSATTTTISNPFAWTGSAANPILLLSNGLGSVATISCPSGACTMTWGGVRDITGSGGATFSASNAFNFGQLSNFTTSSPADATLAAPTAAAVASAVWQDTTAGDFTVALSVGKSVMNGIALGTGLTVNDITSKTGYSLTQSFPTNFAALGISAGGHVSNVDTLTTYTGDTPQTGDTYALANGVNGFVATKADTAAIKGKTDNLPSDPADESLIIAATDAIMTRLGTPASSVSADIAAVKSDTAAILVDTGTTLDAAIAVIDANVDDILLDTAEIGTAGAGLTNINLPNQTMDIVGNITGNLSGSVGSVSGAVGSVSGNVGGTINGLTAVALKDFFDTDSTTTYASAVDGSVVKEIAANAGGGTPPTAAEIADEVETRTIARVTLVDTVTAVTGLTASNLDATISSRATQTSVDDLPTNAELATSQAAADDAMLAAIAALNNISAAEVNAEVDGALADYDAPTHAEMTAELATADDAVLAQVALVKSQTDKLTFTIANQIDSNIHYVNDVQVSGDGAGTPWGPA